MAHDDHMSPWAVHFTSASAGSFDAPGEESGYDNMTSILWHRRIEPVEEPHGGAREIAEISEAHRLARFSEIPLHLLEPLTSTAAITGSASRRSGLSRWVADY